MSCIDQVKLGIWNVAQIGLRTFDGEEGVVLGPKNEGLRLLAAKELMPLVIAS